MLVVFLCPPRPHFSLREDNLVLVLLLSVLVHGKRLTSEVIAVWMNLYPLTYQGTSKGNIIGAIKAVSNFLIAYIKTG